MSDPQAPLQPSAPHEPPARGALTPQWANACVWLVLIPLFAAVVVQTAAAHHPHGWHGLARRAPRAAADGAVHAAIGLAAAVVLHVMLQRGAVWFAVVGVAAAIYVGWDRLGQADGDHTHVWMWVPFA